MNDLCQKCEHERTVSPTHRSKTPTSVPSSRNQAKLIHHTDIVWLTEEANCDQDEAVWTAAQEPVCTSAYTGVTRRRFKEPGELSHHVPLDVRLIGFNHNIFPAVNTSKRAEAAVSNLTFYSLRQGSSANGTDTAQLNVLVKRLKQATPVEALEKWADEKVRRAAARMEIWKGAAAQHRRRSLSDISGVLFFKVAARTRISATHAACRGFRPVDLTISAASVIMRESSQSCENFRCALWEDCRRGGSKSLLSV